MKKAGSAAQFHNVSSSAAGPWPPALGDEGVGVAIAQVVPLSPERHAAGDARIPAQVRVAGAKDLPLPSWRVTSRRGCWWRGLKRAGRELTRERLVTALESLSRTDIGGSGGLLVKQPTTARPSSTWTIIGRGGKFLRRAQPATSGIDKENTR